MAITKRFFGTAPDGKEVHIYKLANQSGLYAEIATAGGAIVSLHVPDRNGQTADVTLGYDSASDYFRQGPYFGAVIGRCANRIGNAAFVLEGKEYKLAKNNGNNHLHGGVQGFDKKVWNAEIVGDTLQLTYRSEDGEEGYPGNLDVKVTYSFTDEGALTIDYEAVTDRTTIVNLTNHAYFNLAGHASGDITKHEVMINADRFTPANAESIPTGELREVRGTPMDFTRLTPIVPGLLRDDEQIANAGGYDHNWVLNVSGAKPEKAAEVYEPSSGRVMEVFTTKPGIQLYTGNYLNGTEIGKGGAVYGKRYGLCLETQFFPNAVNQPNFPSPILRPGETYKHSTSYQFSVR